MSLHCQNFYPIGASVAKPRQSESYASTNSLSTMPLPSYFNISLQIIAWLTQLETIGREPSYHGSISADEAIQRLKASGLVHCYLTHYCETKESFMLSAYMKQKPDDIIEHFKIDYTLPLKEIPNTSSILRICLITMKKI